MTETGIYKLLEMLDSKRFVYVEKLIKENRSLHDKVNKLENLLNNLVHESAYLMGMYANIRLQNM